jgi:hypothetical protein
MGKIQSVIYFQTVTIIYCEHKIKLSEPVFVKVPVKVKGRCVRNVQDVIQYVVGD